MGNYKNYVAKNSWGSTGFAELDKDGNTIGGIPFPSRKYYNLYTDSIGIKGDAINADSVLAFGSNYPYLSRSDFLSFTSLDSNMHWLERGGNASAQYQMSPFCLRSDEGGRGSSTRFVMINY